MYKALVTGGCGFIGSHIVDRLVNDGVETIVIDNLSAISNEKFYFNNKAKYYKIDICDYNSIYPLFLDVDHVFHLAAESRIGPTIENPIKASMTNIVGTNNVLEASRHNKVKKLVYSSTSACYGLSNTIPMRENMTNDCLNPYATTKIAGEELCKMYTKFYGLPTISLRYFNVYGNRSPSNGPYAPVIGIFMKQVKNNEPMTIIGDGLQSRDFVNVLDVVEANLLASLSNNTDAFGQAFNVGSGKNYSMTDLAKMIGGDYNFIDQRPGEARDTLSDNSKICNMLNWTPKYSLIDYIKEKINEY